MASQKPTTKLRYTFYVSVTLVDSRENDFYPRVIFELDGYNEVSPARRKQ